MAAHSAPRKQTPPAKPARTPALEWAAGAAGLALTLGLIGVIGMDALQAGDAPPAVTVRATDILPAPGGYLVLIEAANLGDAAAAQVTVEGRLSMPGMESQTAEAIFDYVAHHSKRQGGLIFAQDPRRGRLELSAKSFVAP
jgi:uncharacterized protein (TIGR02588 family)